MHRIEGSYHLNHFFYEGPPNTTLTADWCNAVQEEIAAVIEAANITLDTAETDSRGQLLEALQSGVIAIGIDKIGVGISPTSMTATAIETFNKTAVQFLMMEEGNNYTNIVGDANRTATDNVIMRLQANWDTTPVAYIDFVSGDDTTNQDDGYLSFSTGEGGAISERMRIEQNGEILYYSSIAGASNFFSFYADDSGLAAILGKNATDDGFLNLYDGSSNLDIKLDTNGDSYFKGGNVGIGLTPTANMSGISVEAGIITLKETTTPTADSGYAKIYPQSDNLMYYQDGDGDEHILMGFKELMGFLNTLVSVYSINIFTDSTFSIYSARGY